MKAIKRFLAAVMIAVMLMGADVPAMAATKPTITLQKQSAAYVKRGKKITFYCRINSGSYKKKNGKYRTLHTFEFRYKSRKGKVIESFDGVLLTGTEDGKDWYKPEKNAKTGTYYWIGNVYYHKTGASKISKVNLKQWKLADSDYTLFKVK